MRRNGGYGGREAKKTSGATITQNPKRRIGGLTLHGYAKGGEKDRPKPG